MIGQIEVVNGAIPLTKTEPEQQWTEEWSSQLYVKVFADGLVGWGEVLPAGGSSRDAYVAIINRLKEEVVGRDESKIGDAWTMMRRITFSGGYGITTGAISGIDIALWDIAGKKANLSLAQLQDGPIGRKVRRYASLSRYSTTDRAVQAVGWLLNRGYQSIKLHQSSRDALDTIRLVREQYGHGFGLTADLNCAFGFGAAMEFMRQVQRYELTWVEEPVWPPDDFESLQKLNRVGPVAAGENAFSIFEFKRLMEMDALTYYQPDVAKIGGVTPALEFLSLAKTHGVNVAFHNRPHNGWVGTMASAQIASALCPESTIETPPNEIPEGMFSFQGSIGANEIEPGGPGLGIAPLGSIPQSNSSKVLKFHES